MRKIISLLLILILAIIGQAKTIRPVNPLPRGVKAVSMGFKNTVFVDPCDNLQTEYDELKSSGYDSVMGILSATNKRFLRCQPGNYSGNIIVNTNPNVVVLEDIPKTCIGLVAYGATQIPINDANNAIFTLERTVVLSDFNNTSHMQDITTDGNYIYSCWTTALAKHTMNGAFVTKNTDLAYHSGGLCCYDANLYVAFSDTFGGTGTVEVRKYKCSDLSLQEAYTISDSEGGIGTVAYYDGSFYVVELLTTQWHSLRIFKYDTSFNLQDTIVLISNVNKDIGWNGLETIERVGSKWLIGTYGVGYESIVCDNDFAILAHGLVALGESFNFSRGIASLGGGIVLRGVSNSIGGGKYSGEVEYVRYDWSQLENKTQEPYIDKWVYVTLTGNGYSTRFSIANSLGMDGYDTSRPRITITPTNVNMAAATYYISGIDINVISIEFSSAPINGEDYTFELRANINDIRKANEVIATTVPLHYIPNIETLRAVRDAINAGGNYEGELAKTAEYVLVADIAMEAEDVNWVPIGTNTHRFGGVLYGGNHTIDGLDIRNEVSYRGLFGYDVNATIQDVNLINISIDSPTVTSIGGLAASVTGGIITNCRVAGTVVGNDSSGGLVGYTSGSTISNCVSTVNVTCNGGGDLYVGGLIGSNMLSSTVESCRATGIITGASCAGGLVGRNSGSTITDCNATGIVTVSYSKGGGLVGLNTATGTVTKCYATGAITGTGGADYIGGLIGYQEITSAVIDSYATGAVVGDIYVGGLLGKADTASIVTSCHATGSNAGGTGHGGLVGGALGEGSTVTYGYYNSTTTGMSDTGKGVAIVDANYTTESYFDGFDFGQTWEMGVSMPELRAAVAGVDYIITETDPYFAASDVNDVNSTDINNWNTAWGWGDHNQAGYLTEESDPCVADINGIVKSDGITISAAIPGTDYVSLILSKFSGYQTDFLAATYSPWAGAAISTGTAAAQATDANHPGIFRIISSTTTNSGYYFLIHPNTFLIAGGEASEFVFSLVTDVNTTVYMGFHDSTTYAAPTDGVWINIAGTTLTGKAKNNAGPTTTDTSYTISTSTWYRAKIVVNAAATRADFYLYTCSNGAQVWTNNVQANIPTAAGRVTGHGVIATSTNTVATNLIDVDYMNITINKDLIR